jgi:hypothetical protein
VVKNLILSSNSVNICYTENAVSLCMDFFKAPASRGGGGFVGTFIYENPPTLAALAMAADKCQEVEALGHAV